MVPAHSTVRPNARSEGINRLVKQVKRSGCGFRNVDNQHRRVRFHCTRTHREQQRHQDHCPLKFEEPVSALERVLSALTALRSSLIHGTAAEAPVREGRRRRVHYPVLVPDRAKT